jgi:SAM-dependent methyltransferase
MGERSLNRPAPGPRTVWPPEDLEHLGACPLCGDARRSLMFGSLRDLSFGVAPGQWTLWRCLACSAGYLDPRPSESSIERAYGGYYTQARPNRGLQLAHIGGSGLKARLRLGYYNARYGFGFPGGWPAGFMLACLTPRIRAQWDHYIRHLERPAVLGAKLLDIGCGSGEFLYLAQALGYSATGLDRDPGAVAGGRAAGLDVRAGKLPDTGLPGDSYDHITLSHVFEHLHGPRMAAAELLRLLKPGGRVWFSQPNIDADGLKLFGDAWRGLEAPRHLCLPSLPAFEALLRSAGFVDVRTMPPRPYAEVLFKASLYMARGAIPRNDRDPPDWNALWRKRARRAERAAMREPSRAECLTVTARKPGVSLKAG